MNERLRKVPADHFNVFIFNFFRIEAWKSLISTWERSRFQTKAVFIKPGFGYSMVAWENRQHDVCTLCIKHLFTHLLSYAKASFPLMGEQCSSIKCQINNKHCHLQSWKLPFCLSATQPGGFKHTKKYGFCLVLSAENFQFLDMAVSK